MPRRRGDDPGSTQVTVPLPDLADCVACASLVHDRLKDQPGVRLVTIDRSAREARVEFEADALSPDVVAGLLRSVVGGATRRPSLEEAHAAHRERDEHAHDHAHGFGSGAYRELARTNRRRLLLVVVLGSLVIAVQLLGGWLSGSLLLLSDAAHMATDVASVGLAAYAVHVATRPATREKTFGWHRSEIVAAFLNAVGLWVVSAFFAVEAIRRIRAPPDVEGRIVLGVGALTLAVNLFLAWLLHRGSGQNLNVRTAYVHILSDVLGSAGALVAGAVILLFGWTWADPVLTLAVTALLVGWTWRLTRQTLHILLEGTPEETDTEAIRLDVLDVPGVRALHDLHVWSLTTGIHSMSAHIVVDEPTRGPEIARDVRRMLETRHGLDHVTLEVEAQGMHCEACP